MNILQAYGDATYALDGNGKYTRATRKYFVRNADSEAHAIEFAYEELPKTVNGLDLTSVELTDRIAERDYAVTASYELTSDSESAEQEPATMSFDCGGGTKHLTWSLAPQRCLYGSDKAGDAIGWNGKDGDESQIAGVDVPAAQLRETYTKVFSKSKLTTAYKRKVAALTSAVNSDKFKGWDPGEVMFLGCSYLEHADSKYVTVTFNFAIQPNEPNAVVSGHSIGAVKGWEYVWAVSKTDDTQQDTDQIYAATVAEYLPFSALGI